MFRYFFIMILFCVGCISADVYSGISPEFINSELIKINSVSRIEVNQELTYLLCSDGSKIEARALRPEKGSNNWTMKLKSKADPVKNYKFVLNGQEFKIDKNGILNDAAYIYKKTDLGITFTNEEIIIKVWTPVAEKVNLLLFDDYNIETAFAYPMVKTEQGVWKTGLPLEAKGKYYLFEVTVNGETKTTPDPYGIGLSANSKRSLIADLRVTDPVGWNETPRPDFIKMTDAVIYELHVRDISIHKSSGIRNKGKYLAFTEKETKSPEGYSTGISHLKEMGVTHIHLLPVYDFGSVDENRQDMHNWGYDPVFYNVPEGSYSTDPNGISRIKEFKEMIKSFHESGLRVVMDVVYNHTYKRGVSAFDILVPGYYYRFNADGSYSDASACGNEVATEKAMVRNFILHSLKFWANEYKIDGFRFDLLGVFDTETVSIIGKELKKLDPSLLLYGEPWAPGASPIPENKRLIKGNQKNTNVAVFNDNLRDAVKGDTQGDIPGFVQGVDSLKPSVMKGIEGSINDFTLSPEETINYVSSHDDLCLWDKLIKTSKGKSEDYIIKLSKLANGIVFLSQGIPFMQGGEEFGRTKKMFHNTYNKGDEYNQFDYSLKAKYSGLTEYYKGLIKLRKAHPAFRMNTSDQVKKNLRFLDSPAGTLSYSLSNRENGENSKLIVVLINASDSKVTFKLPDEREWTIIADGEKAGEVIGKFTGADAVVEGKTLMVLKNN